MWCLFLLHLPYIFQPSQAIRFRILGSVIVTQLKLLFCSTKGKKGLFLSCVFKCQFHEPLSRILSSLHWPLSSPCTIKHFSTSMFMFISTIEVLMFTRGLKTFLGMDVRKALPTSTLVNLPELSADTQDPSVWWSTWCVLDRAFYWGLFRRINLLCASCHLHFHQRSLGMQIENM